VELYGAVRRAVMVDGLSHREAARRFGVHRNTISKMLQYSAPPGYRRREAAVSPKLGPHIAWIDAVLEADRGVHAKQRHTAQRLFDRLRAEEGYTGGYTIVREYVASATLRSREMFVPLSHRPGHAQADFGEADAIIAGQKVRFHYFCMDLPQSDDAFVKAYPRLPPWECPLSWLRSPKTARPLSARCHHGGPATGRTAPMSEMPPGMLMSKSGLSPAARPEKNPYAETSGVISLATVAKSGFASANVPRIYFALPVGPKAYTATLCVILATGSGVSALVTDVYCTP
jgi:transposase